MHWPGSESNLIMGIVLATGVSIYTFQSKQAHFTFYRSLLNRAVIAVVFAIILLLTPPDFFR